MSTRFVSSQAFSCCNFSFDLLFLNTMLEKLFLSSSYHLYMNIVFHVLFFFFFIKKRCQWSPSLLSPSPFPPLPFFFFFPVVFASSFWYFFLGSVHSTYLSCNAVLRVFEVFLLVFYMIKHCSYILIDALESLPLTAKYLMNTVVFEYLIILSN